MALTNIKNESTYKDKEDEKSDKGKDFESTGVCKLEERKIYLREGKDKTKIHDIVNNVKMTLQHLDDSIKSTHATEMKLFQDELKLVMDNQQLLFQLDKEKFKNAQLKRFASSGSIYFQSCSKRTNCDMNNELKSLKDRCNILSDVLRKRDCQLRKAKQEMEMMQVQTNGLQKAIKIKEKKYRRLLNKYAELHVGMKTVGDNHFGHLKQEIIHLQTQVKNQEKQNHNLTYINNRLKIALTRNKSLYDLATQVSEHDFLVLEKRELTG